MPEENPISNALNFELSRRELLTNSAILSLSLLLGGINHRASFLRDDPFSAERNKKLVEFYFLHPEEYTELSYPTREDFNDQTGPRLFRQDDVAFLFNALTAKEQEEMYKKIKSITMPINRFDHPELFTDSDVIEKAALNKLTGKLVWPIDHPKLSQRFAPWHSGIDIAYGEGSLFGPVRAADGGVVVGKYGSTMGYGNHLIIYHGCNLFTLYAHLLEMDVSPTESVEQFQQIGKVGSTGSSSGPHLHFGVIKQARQEYQSLNPLLQLP